MSEQSIKLGGEWKIVDETGAYSLRGSVPGCVHTALLANGDISDPFYRDNELEQFWVGERDWIYERTFEMTEELRACDRVNLVAESLDTECAVWVNGQEVGRAENQFRRYEFDVKSWLKPGKNTLEIRFAAPIRLARERQAECYLWHTGIGHHRIEGGNHLRKSQCNFGWDWGPEVPTVGIPGAISLVGVSRARLGGLSVEQVHEENHVDVVVRGYVESVFEIGQEGSDGEAGDLPPGGAATGPSSAGAGGLASGGEALGPDGEKLRGGEELRVSANLRFDGRFVADESIEVRPGRRFEMRLRVSEPRLWWPNGLGEQPLYELGVALTGETGTDGREKQLDGHTRTIGLRTIGLAQSPDEWGRAFRFVVNGVPVFAKGANWIPADAFVDRLGEEHYEHLIASSAAANMNMLRVWGGGIYEPEIFFDLCDRYGIMVWQDFMFACSAYPSDEAFLENVAEEVRQQVERLHTHASLALWCGNNEMEQIPGCIGETKGAMSWADYKKVFDELLPRLVREGDPATAYWPSSPHSPDGDRSDVQNPKWGDAHLWDVWHGRQPFEFYRGCTHRFNSEFGFQSFPEPRVVEAFTEPGDRNVSSYIMDFHQRSNIGNDAIIQQMLAWFPLPGGTDKVLWASQILQALAIQYGVEHWRRSMPRGMGTLYWQLNDCWPVASWASIDYFGNWKALQYFARDFFAPVLLSAVEHIPSRRVAFHLSNDLTVEIDGTLEVVVYTTDGEVVARETRNVGAGPVSSEMVFEYTPVDDVARMSERELIVKARFADSQGARVSETRALFARPKHLKLRKPELAVRNVRFADDALGKDGGCTVAHGNDSVQGIERAQGQTPLQSNGSGSGANGTYLVDVTTDVPALWVWLDIPDVQAMYSDRYFDLMPGQTRTVEVTPLHPIRVEELTERITSMSIYDFW